MPGCSTIYYWRRIRYVYSTHRICACKTRGVDVYSQYPVKNNEYGCIKLCTVVIVGGNVTWGLTGSDIPRQRRGKKPPDPEISESGKMSLRGSTIIWQCCPKSINYRSQGATYTIFRQTRLLSFAVKHRCGMLLTYVSLLYRTISSLLWIQVVFLEHDIFPF